MRGTGHGEFDFFRSGGARGGGEMLPGYAGVAHFWLGDVRQVTGREMLRALGMERGALDCVVGGPPCQGFSVMGRRNVHDPRNSLVFEFARLVCELAPKTFILENVPGMLTMKTPEGVPVLDALCRMFADGGMGTYEAIRNALCDRPTRRAVVHAERTRKPGKRRRA